MLNAKDEKLGNFGRHITNLLIRFEKLIVFTRECNKYKGKTIVREICSGNTTEY